LLLPEPGNWEFARAPDYQDVFLFGTLCEPLRVEVIKERREGPVEKVRGEPEDDEFLSILQDMQVDQGLIDTYHEEDRLYKTTSC